MMRYAFFSRALAERETNKEVRVEGLTRRRLGEGIEAAPQAAEKRSEGSLRKRASLAASRVRRQSRAAHTTAHCLEQCPCVRIAALASQINAPEILYGSRQTFP